MPIYEEYLRRLIEVNDETKTDAEHRAIDLGFNGWIDGVDIASGTRFNGDYYYIEKFDSGEMVERPLCCGKFLDWRSQATVTHHNKD